MYVTLLSPVDGRKSFYGKAIVKIENATETLQSYDTDVIKRLWNGNLVRLWGGWSATTGRHIYAFCGIRKAQWDKMTVGCEYSLSELMN